MGKTADRAHQRCRSRHWSRHRHDGRQPDHVTREEREAIVDAAWDAGVRYVDTAPFYGVGAAERRVGDALRDQPRDEWVLSTKVGRLLRPQTRRRRRRRRPAPPLPFEVVYDYSYDGIMRSVEDSYQRLGLARIDILYVHDIGVYQHGAEANAAHMKVLRDSGYRALDELRRTGAVSAIGIGVNEKEVLIEALEFGDWDAFLLAGRYTLLEQAPLDDLLPKCAARGTSIVVGGPLNSGILAGRDTWNYAAAPPEIVARVTAIQRGLRRARRAAAGGGAAVPAGASGGCRDHPRPAQRRRSSRPTSKLLRQPIPAALWADLRAGGPAASRRADAVLIHCGAAAEEQSKQASKQSVRHRVSQSAHRVTLRD